jgi:hypothetical protein
MLCPNCGHEHDRVVDSRSTREGAAIRRRRECLQCHHRFTTYEYVESTPVLVVKRDGRRVAFDREKVINGVMRACEKRAISRDGPDVRHAAPVQTTTDEEKPMRGESSATRRSLRDGLFLFLVAAAAAVLVSGVATAADYPLYDKKVRFEGNGNYYELVRAEPGQGIRKKYPYIIWDRARIEAQRRSYKGVRGRLAIVDSRALDNFLFETFRPENIAWIGLRYWCEYNKLMTSENEIYARTRYANWSRQWATAGGGAFNPSQPRCSKDRNYWPVHYWGTKHGGHAGRWNANGMIKEGHEYFVEYVVNEE